MSIVEPGANGEFLAEFLEDYFAECDEHLTSIRRNLLSLEQEIDRPQAGPAVLDELFRSFHTLKGISGMVGVLKAEQLAHQMESYLRALRDGQQTLTPEGMDALIAGTRAMEQVIAERRTQAPATDPTPVMARLAGLTPEPAPMRARPPAPAPHSLSAAEDGRIAAAIEGGKKVWRFEFVPSPDLARRGINVNVVRARLEQAGELIHAAPRVLPQGGIAFEFFVASQADEKDFAAWRDDGLACSPYESLRPAAPEPAAEEMTKAPAPQPFPSLSPANVVRVDLGRLDDLMRMVGEMVVSRSRLEDQLNRLEGSLPAPAWRSLQETSLAMERQLRGLREGVMRVRMVPIGEIFERMRFVVRDLAGEYGKKVRLELSGQQSEIDKLLVERMMDPILHLVRNAISHGLEDPGERVAAGKPPEGRIALRAEAAAEMIVIEIEDDGAGIRKELVAERARAMGLAISETGLDSAALLDLLCLPGFSTRDEADRASGRGVGMNVVKNTVLGLGGSFELETEAGRGTRFTIQLPLTLAIADALIITAGEQIFAVPQSSIREVIEVESSAVKTLENNEVILYRGGVLPLLRIARHFRLGDTARASFHAFVVGSGPQAVGVVVDRILGQREIVVQAIIDPLIQVEGVAGATELGDGRIVLILDAAALARSARKTDGGRLE